MFGPVLVIFLVLATGPLNTTEGSWEEVPASLFFFSCLVDFHAIKVVPDKFPFSPFEDIASEQDKNILYNFTPPAPLPPKQYVNDFFPSSDSII